MAAQQVKAEALYNLCEFEHSLVAFCRGRRLAPDKESFSNGMVKCKGGLTV